MAGAVDAPAIGPASARSLRGNGKGEPNGSMFGNQGEMMKNGISELSDLEIDEVSGGGVMYVLGY
ncbi:MAG: hypothetical protein ACXVG9_11110, partial [Terriglobales bacterium]